MLTTQQCQKARMARDPRFDGKFFILVKSTGIFCRPVCKVRAPLEKNVEYAFSAIDAMRQGFRPCLRCRPDSQPYSPPWQGVQTTAKRAAKLLTEDFSSSVGVIAERLGISSRYLHKLMLEHWYVSPKQFRVCNQIMLAKRLLHHSNMSIEQVATSAGFSSARQLQYHMKALMQLTPSQVRSASKSSQTGTEKTALSNNAGAQHHDKLRDDKLEMTNIFLPYQGAYNWQAIRDFFSRRLIQNNEAIDNDSFTKTFNIHDHAVKVRMQHVQASSGFEVSFNQSYLSYTHLIIERVQHVLDLHANPYVIVDALKSSGLPTKFIDAGMRIPGICSQFEAGVRAILGQQVSVSAAITQLNRLVKGLNENNESFIKPQQVVNSDLAFIKLPQARKNALKAFSEYMCTQTDSIEHDVSACLSIKGIGPWTVNYIKMRASRHTDMWLETDLIIRQKASEIEKRGLKFSPDNAAPWRSYLTLGLWHLNFN
ncbi:DNA-3-methyladenine glycosylase 2 family protein [Ningiella sp. W23]|uniref:DNA-3-methyladenine glycosylase 2 family protein n=1 Tax=Ningiella sp. W23 TaxID=3023715 RepID=UPI003757D9BE